MGKKEMNATRVRIDLEDGPYTGPAATIRMGSTEPGRIPRFDVGAIYGESRPPGMRSYYEVVERTEGEGSVTLRCKFVGHDLQMRSLPGDDDTYRDYYQVVRRIIDGLFLSLGYHPDDGGGADRYNKVIEKFSEVLQRSGDLRCEAMETLVKNYEKFIADTHTLLEGLTNDKHRRALFGAIIALDELKLSGKP